MVQSPEVLMGDRAEKFSAAASKMRGEDVTAAVHALVEPCYESQLLDIAFPGLDVLRCSALTLFQTHFLLFHHLYQMQEKFYEIGKYLHIHCMRIFPVSYPPPGFCRHFDEGLMAFCAAGCPPGEALCSFHRERCPEGYLDSLSAKYFYLDQMNFFQLTEETAEDFLNGAWETLRQSADIKNAFITLGLAEAAGIQAVKLRFRELARRFHPDLGAKSTARFVEINKAYHLLMRILPTMNFKFHDICPAREKKL